MNLQDLIKADAAPAPTPTPADLHTPPAGSLRISDVMKMDDTGTVDPQTTDQSQPTPGADMPRRRYSVDTKPFFGGEQGPLDAAAHNVKATVGALVDPEFYRQIGHDLTTFPKHSRDASGKMALPAMSDKDGQDMMDLALSWTPGGSVPKATRNTILKQPARAADVEKLAGEGVRMTPGSELGGVFKRAEDAATTYPIVGDAIKGAGNRSIEDLNKAAINRALAPIGEKLPKEMDAGFAAIDHAGDKLSHAYDALLPKLTGELDLSLQQDIAREVAHFQKLLPPDQRVQLASIVKEKVTEKFDPTTKQIDGESLKTMQSELSRWVRKFGKGEGADSQTMSEALAAVRAAVTNMLKAKNPIYGKDLDSIDRGYANLLRVERAAVGTKKGIFSPAELGRAVRYMDESLRSRNVSRGRALMQDLSSSAQNVLPSTVNDSGTASRMLPYLMMTGAGAAGGSGMVSPETAAALLAITGAYTPAGRSLVKGAGKVARAPGAGRSALGFAAGQDQGLGLDNREK